MAKIGLALLIVDDKILMFKRSTHPDDVNPGKYGLVGGHIKKDETPLEGTKREAKEEASLDLTKLKFIDSYKHDDDVLYVYGQELPNTEGIYLNPEHTAFKLFKPDQLDKPSIIPTTKFMYHDYMKKIGNKKK